MFSAGVALATTPLAAKAMGLRGIALTQVIMGIAAGPIFPASTQLLSRRLNPKQRAMAATTLDTGITVGGLTAVPLSTFLALRFGCEYVMVFYGMGSIIYALIWMKFVGGESSDLVASKHDGADKTKVATKYPNAAKANANAKTGLAGVFEGVKHIRLWAIYFSHFTFNHGVHFINDWQSTFYLETFNLRPEKAGWLLSAPHAFNLMVMVLINPALESYLQRTGASDLSRRRTFTGIGFAVTAVAMGLVPYMSSISTTPYLVTLCMSIGLGFQALHPSGFKANYMDVTNAHSGVVSGIGNTIASLASSFGPLAVTQLRAVSGSWVPAFASVTLLNVVAMIFFCTMSKATPFEADNEKTKSNGSNGDKLASDAKPENSSRMPEKGQSGQTGARRRVESPANR